MLPEQSYPSDSVLSLLRNSAGLASNNDWTHAARQIREDAQTWVKTTHQSHLGKRNFLGQFVHSIHSSTSNYFKTENLPVCSFSRIRQKWQWNRNQSEVQDPQVKSFAIHSDIVAKGQFPSSIYNGLLRQVLSDVSSPKVLDQFDPEPSSGLFAEVGDSKAKYTESAIRVLDAPGLPDNFYYNLLDWGQTNNSIAIRLENSVYAWPADSLEATKILLSEVCSLKWTSSGDLVVGEKDGKLRLIDISKKTVVQRYSLHNSQVGVLDTQSLKESGLIASSSRDGQVKLIDTRKELIVSVLPPKHKLEVCGLKFSPHGTYLATGGAEGNVFVWDLRNTQRPWSSLIGHNAAVRAVAWSPYSRHSLASGGGTTDKTIRTWNSSDQSCTNLVHTKSQVCGLVYSGLENTIVSAQGHSENCLHVWDSNLKKKLATLNGHTSRVLYLAMSPDSRTVLSGAGNGDETLRFWKAASDKVSNRNDNQFLNGTNLTMR